MNSTSLNEIAYNLLNTLRGGRSSNTEYLSLEQIKHMIKYYRSVFIRRDLERNNNRIRMFEQDLGVVPLEEVDTAEDDSVDSGNTIHRTTKRLPTPIRLKRSEAITHISSVGKISKPIPLIDTVKSYWNQFNTYISSNPHAFFRDGYIYIENEDDLDSINIRGVFEDPEKVHEFTRDNGLDLYDEDSPFPIPQDMLEGIIKGIINGELRIIQPEDNDTETDTLQN